MSVSEHGRKAKCHWTRLEEDDVHLTKHWCTLDEDHSARHHCGCGYRWANEKDIPAGMCLRCPHSLIQHRVYDRKADPISQGCTLCDCEVCVVIAAGSRIYRTPGA
jgi:hypothetical protein